MDKIIKLTAMILGTAFFIGCAKEEVQDSNGNELIKFTIQASVTGTNGLDIDTKVALDGLAPKWETGDQILVLDANKNIVGATGIFTLTGEGGTTSGMFEGGIFNGQMPAYAIYPASSAVIYYSYDSATVTKGSLDFSNSDAMGTIKSAIMLGNSTDGKSFNFKNVCAVLKFNTGSYGSGSNPIKAITASAYYGTEANAVSTAGLFSIDWSDLSISAIPSSTDASISVPSSLQGSNKIIYLPILPLPKNGSGVAPSMGYIFEDTSCAVAEISYNFDEGIANGTIKDLGTAKNLNFETRDYVIIKAKYDGTNTTALKWHKQNLAISTSGNYKWKGNSTSAVKVPRSNDDVVIGDYFQWAAYKNYQTVYGSDQGLLRYKSFEKSKYVEGSETTTNPSITLKSGSWFSDEAPYYSSSSYSKYTTSGQILEMEDDAANILLSETWRIPTRAELIAMIDATVWVKDTDDCGYYVFAPNAKHLSGTRLNHMPSDYDKSRAFLFFPLSGNISTRSISSQGVSMGYWTSLAYSNGYAYYFYYPTTSYGSREYGRSIRPVSN